MEEVIKKRKAKEEEQIKQRQEEEKNWSLAMSGELSGPRQAALGAVQGVVETQHLIEDSYKDEVLYTGMYKGNDKKKLLSICESNYLKLMLKYIHVTFGHWLFFQ